MRRTRRRGVVVVDLRFNVSPELEANRVVQSLSDSEGWDEGVVLHYVACVVLPIRMSLENEQENMDETDSWRTYGLAVDEDVARDFADLSTASENVEECGLARTGGAHDRCEDEFGFSRTYSVRQGVWVRFRV